MSPREQKRHKPGVLKQKVTLSSPFGLDTIKHELSGGNLHNDELLAGESELDEEEIENQKKKLAGI